MSTNVSFEGSDGKSVSGAIAEPAGTGKVPTVVLVQEYWGLNAHVKSLVDRLASEGFVVVADDGADAFHRFGFESGWWRGTGCSG